MLRSIFLFSIIYLYLSTNVIYGQGCSDAGFCTINSFKPSNTNGDTSTSNQVKIGVFYGSANHSIAVWGNYLEYNRQLTPKLGFDLKLTSISQNGNGINTFGISDLFLSGTHKFLDELKFTAGLKIPLTNGNKKNNNVSLPMDYQSSLGSLDLIVGAGYEIKNLQIGLALQQPLIQNNNTFIAENHAANSSLSKFQTTNNYKRNGDLLFRISYGIKLFNNFRITPSVLPILHLANDKFTDTTGVETAIIGSKGLTLNGNLYLDYILSSKSSIQLNAGMPFVVRDVRPDGLTRSFIANLEYRIKF